MIDYIISHGTTFIVILFAIVAYSACSIWALLSAIDKCNSDKDDGGPF